MVSASTERNPERTVTSQPSIRARLRARFRARALDRELAGEVREHLSPALALRARILLQPPTRRALCDQLRRIVREAHEPAQLTRRVPIRRREVVEAEGDLRLLASRLDSPSPVAVRGLAKVRILLTDGCGPLYHRDSSEDLGAAVHQALAALT
jgi:hypothetical protein